MTSAPSPARDDNAVRVMHFNINCRDFDRSIAFYQLIGFRPYGPAEPGAPLGVMGRFGAVGLGPVLGLPDNCDGRFMALSVGGEAGGTVLDLIEWTEPRIEAQPRRIVYVSSNPTTLAPNAAQLTEAGYVLRKVRPVDMFPQTPHVECVALLERD